MTSSLPVTKEESSEARNRTPLAMSSTVPSLPSGMLPKNACRRSGSARTSSDMAVTIRPGWTELQRMLSAACWIAVDSVRRRPAPLLAW